MLRNDGKNSALLYTIGNIAYLFSQWLISALTVRISGLEDAGYFGMAITLGNVFTSIANYGIRPYQISDLKSLFNNSDYVYARLATTAAAFALCIFYSCVSDYNQKQLLVIVLYCVFKCCEALYDVFHGVWQKNNRLTAVGISLIEKAIWSTICFFTPYLITKEILSGLLLMSASAIILLYKDLCRTRRWGYDVDIKKSSSKKAIVLLKSMFVMMMLTLCIPMQAAISRIILEKNAGSETLGIYTSLLTPANVILTFISTFFSPLIPQYALAYEKKDCGAIRKRIFISCGATVVIGIAACIAIHFLGYWALKLVYSEVVAGYYKFMYGTVLNVVLLTIITCLNNFLTGIRKLKQELAFMTGAVCFALYSR